MSLGIATLLTKWGIKVDVGKTTPEFPRGFTLGDKVYESTARLKKRIFSNTAPSSEIADTADPEVFDLSATIPANTLQAGDVLEITAVVTVTEVNGTPDLSLDLLVGGVPRASVADVAVLDGEAIIFKMRAKLVDVGQQALLIYTDISLATAGEGSVASSYDVLTTDPSAAIPISVRAEWSAAHANNKASLTWLDVNVV